MTLCTEAPPDAWVLATTNKGKRAELAALLDGREIQLHTSDQWALPPVAETGATFIENALIKARHASSHTGLPALADDSGLVVPALGGQPGIHSARYAGTQADDASNNRRLLQQMQHLQGEARRAYLYCVLVWLENATDPAPVIAQGRLWVKIAHQPVGNKGFGYDPLLLVSDTTSLATISREHKNRISHRAQATAQLLSRLEDDVWTDKTSTSRAWQ